MKCKVNWLNPQDMVFIGESGSGHIVAMDGAPEAGGRNLAARPMEMLLMGLGGCASFDVVLILKKSRQVILNCCVDIEAERAESDPKVFTKIHMHFTVTGHELNPQTVQRAIELSHDKYCSASIMLGKTATISTSFEILQQSPTQQTDASV